MTDLKPLPLSNRITYEQCPAKAYVDEFGQVCLGFNVFDHTYIVGMVAKEIISIFPKEMIDLFFPNGTELIVACHDLGKVSPTFYLKLKFLISKNPNDYHPTLYGDYKDLVDQENKQWGGHSTVSAVTLKEVSKDKFIYKIAGSHHGGLHQKTKRITYDDEIFGGEEWHRERIRLVEGLKTKFGCDFPHIENEVQARILSGLTTIADWIGSGGVFSQPKQNWEKTLPVDLKTAVQDAGFRATQVKKGLTFADLFGNGFEANDLQTQLYNQGVVQGLNFVEAPMGMGKTETGLYMAYKALEQGLATGIYFGLPTQLTSNKIYDRFNEFLDRILEDSSQKALLLHSNAWLMNTTLGEEGEVGKSWFDQGKRKILAPYGVGTLDQALMSVIHVRHNFVRSFGLMGKVVILDEVHSYDVYTGLLMDELVKHLLDLKCTVIILSATLTKARKIEIMGQQYQASNTYPCITTYDPSNQSVKEIAVAYNDSSNKSIDWVLSNSKDSFDEAIKRANEGQYVLWIENTVDDAIKVYQKFSAYFNDSDVECGLLHSRFTFEDRQEIEDKWVYLFGKHNQNRYAGNGKILIGTQILEQSLDIDADFLVTRICPIDLLMQRSGRLWRHVRSNRHPNALCQMNVLSPSFEQTIKTDIKGFGASAMIYYPYVLLKTLWAIEQYKLEHNTLQIPSQIPNLIESVYSDTGAIEDQLTSYKNEMLNGKGADLGLLKLKQLARSKVAKLGSALKDDEQATTRYIDQETVDMLLLSNLHFKDGVLNSVTLINGSVLYLMANDARSKKGIALQLAQNTVKVPKNKLRKMESFSSVPTPLKPFFGFDKQILICLINGRNLNEINGILMSEKKIFQYSKKIGLVFKDKESS